MNIEQAADLDCTESGESTPSKTETILCSYIPGSQSGGITSPMDYTYNILRG